MNLNFFPFHKNQIKSKSNWKIGRYCTKSRRLNSFEYYESYKGKNFFFFINESEEVHTPVGNSIFFFCVCHNWHECAAFQWLTAGNDIVAPIFIRPFLLFFPPVPPSQPFLIEGVVGSKNLFSESCIEHPKT